MIRTYEIILAGEPVATREAGTPLLALIDYLREAGCPDRDIVRLGPESVSWRGAVYRASPYEAASSDEPASDVAARDSQSSVAS